MNYLTFEHCNSRQTFENCTIIICNFNIELADTDCIYLYPLREVWKRGRLERGWLLRGLGLYNHRIFLQFAEIVANKIRSHYTSWVLHSLGILWHLMLENVTHSDLTRSNTMTILVTGPKGTVFFFPGISLQLTHSLDLRFFFHSKKSCFFSRKSLKATYKKNYDI